MGIFQEKYKKKIAGRLAGTSRPTHDDESANS